MKILILASNPRKDLNLDDELRILQTVLNQSPKRDQFSVEKEVGVRVGDLQDLVLRYEPEIIHFCGHGGGEEGLIFKVDGGGEQRVRAEALAGLFKLCPSVKCVLLNACYSQEQADAIAQHTEYVIGMSHTIQDNAAIAFSKGFYTALGYDRSIERSFEFGKNAIQLEVSESSINRSGVGLEERKAEVVDIVKGTELKEHEKPRLFIRGQEQTASALEQILSSQSISNTEMGQVLVKIDASLASTNAQPEQELKAFSFQVPTVILKKGLVPARSSIEINYRDGKAEFFEEKLDDSTVLEMVKISGGLFTMGSPATEKERSDDEGPQHLVRIKPFFIGKYPITQAQWFAVAQDYPKEEIDLNSDLSYLKGSNRPVEQVCWDEAVEFCARLSRKTDRQYRLPSEAEWEYACRAGTTTPFHCGETITTDLANYNGDYTYGAEPKGAYREQTTDVGSFSPNGFGLYDMHGNVWEWCADRWHDNYAEAPTDGSAWVDGDKDYRLLRGGSWHDVRWFCRSASRAYNDPVDRYNNLGFRVVCDVA